MSLSDKLFFLSITCSFVIPLRVFVCLFLKTKPQRASRVSSCKHPRGWVDPGSCCGCEHFIFGADGGGPCLERVMSLENRWMGCHLGIKTTVLLLLGDSGLCLPFFTCPGPSQTFPALCGSAAAAGGDPSGQELRSLCPRALQVLPSLSVK